ncbi:MAG: EamA family transporter [Alphaproteobacteria bacterium]|nr:EamA family transporter [Alphaproteobacteria bacterium]
MLFFLGSAWGSSFMFIKIGIGSIPPVTLAAARVLIGAALLAAIARAQGRHFPPIGRVWLLFLLIGLTGNALPFALIGVGETLIDSALAAVLIATVPLFTMCLAHFFAADDRLSAGKILGLVLGFSGVVLLIGPDALAGAQADVLGAAAIVGAALGYAVTNIAAQQARRLPAVVAGACTLACAALWAVPASLLLERPWTVSPGTDALLALLALTLVSTAAGNLVFFRLIARTGPSFVSFNNYLIPGMGVIFGTLFLGEEIGLRTLGALALILLGIAAATDAGPRLWRSLQSRRTGRMPRA